jgi:hypothetical protein
VMLPLPLAPWPNATVLKTKSEKAAKSNPTQDFLMFTFPLLKLGYWRRYHQWRQVTML